MSNYFWNRYLASQSDYLKEKIHIWVRRKVYEDQILVVEGKILAQYKEGLANSQPWQGLALGMVDILSLKVCKQGEVIT